MAAPGSSLVLRADVFGFVARVSWKALDKYSRSGTDKYAFLQHSLGVRPYCFCAARFVCSVK